LNQSIDIGVSPLTGSSWQIPIARPPFGLSIVRASCPAQSTSYRDLEHLTISPAQLYSELFPFSHTGTADRICNSAPFSPHLPGILVPRRSLANQSDRGALTETPIPPRPALPRASPLPNTEARPTPKCAS
jgi:hypothetical protein